MREKRKMLLVVAALTLMCGVVFGQPAEHAKYVPGQALVKFHSEFIDPEFDMMSRMKSDVSLSRICDRYDIRGMEPLLRDGGRSELNKCYVLRIDKGADPMRLAEELALNANIEWAEPNWYVHIVSITPNDPDYGEQWALHNVGGGDKKADADIDAPEAWAITTGNASVTVAVLDTGIDLNHPDLSDNVIAGYDYANSDSDPQDDHGHGTIVAGIIGAVGNNGEGIAGVAWNCKLMPVKVLDDTGYGTISDVSAGIAYAQAQGADVINMSFGDGFWSPPNALNDAVQDAYTNGVVLIGAAGNSCSSNLFYPAAFDNVLAATATDYADELQSYANFGDWIHVAAPGYNIRSALWDNMYGNWTGTSMAAAYVSGIAALVRSFHGAMDPDEVYGQIRFTTDNIDSENPTRVGLIGTGRVNAYRALAESPEPNLVYNDSEAEEVGGDGDGWIDPNEDGTIVVTVENDWASAFTVIGTLSTTAPPAYVSITDGSAGFGDILPGDTGDNLSNPFTISVLAGCPEGYVIPFQLHLVEAGGYSTDLSFDVEVGREPVLVSGSLTGNITWTEGHSYIIQRAAVPTILELGATLTIEQDVKVFFEKCSGMSNACFQILGTCSVAPGVLFEMGDDAELEIYGLFTARGTANKRIRFHRADSGDECSIRFLDAAADAAYSVGGAYQSGCIIEYADIDGIDDFTIDSCSPCVQYCNISECGNQGGTNPNSIYLQDSDSRIRYNDIRSPKVNCRILRIGGGKPRIESNIIRDTYDMIGVGVAVFNVDSEFVFQGNIVRNCVGGGIYLDGVSGGIGTISYNLFSENGFSAYNSVGPFFVSGNWNFSYNSIVTSFMGSGESCVSADVDYSHNYPLTTINDNNILARGSAVAFTGWQIPIPGSDSIDCRYNYWGEAVTEELDAVGCNYGYDEGPSAINDYRSIGGAALVICNLCDYRSEPVDTRVPIITNVTITPAPPVGAEPIYFDIFFGSPMETDPASDEIEVAFGPSAPYDHHKVTGRWLTPKHWYGVYFGHHYMYDGTHTLLIRGAKTIPAYSGFEIPPYEKQFTVSTCMGPVEGVGIWGRIDTVTTTWQPVLSGFVSGYNLYYDFDEPALPLNGTGAVEGDSPINVGDVNNFDLRFPLTLLLEHRKMFLDGSSGTTVYVAIQPYDFAMTPGDYSEIVWANLDFYFVETPTPKPVPAGDASSNVLLAMLLGGAILFGLAARARMPKDKRL